MIKEFLIHACDHGDMIDAELIAEASTLQEARAIVAKGDPQKFHSIIDRYGFGFTLTETED